MSLFTYVRSLKKFFHRDEIIDDIRVSMREYSEFLIPALRAIYSYVELNPLTSEEARGYNQVFITNVGSINTTGNFIQDLDKHSKLILKHAEFIKDELQKILPEQNIAGGLTAKKAILIRSSEQFSFFVDYLSKLLNAVYIDETHSTLMRDGKIDEDGKGKIEVDLSPAQRKELDNGMYEFIKAFDTLTRSDFESSISKIPNVAVIDVTKSDMEQNPALAMLQQTILDPFNTTSMSNATVDPDGNLMRGFIGNPLYHLSTMKSMYLANKYRTAQERRKVIEMRLMYLRSLQKKEYSASVENKINKMQEYLNNLEYSLEGMKGK